MNGDHQRETIRDAVPFGDQVRAGHGRAVKMLRDGGCRAEQLPIILRACVECLTYDRQSEQSRENYLAKLIEYSGAAEELLPEIWQTLRRSSLTSDITDRAQEQMLQLARVFAARGHAEARAALFETFERNCGVKRYQGAIEIVELDQAEGYAFVLDLFAVHNVVPALEEWVFPYIRSMVYKWILGRNAARAVERKALKRHPILRDWFREADDSDEDPPSVPCQHLLYDQYRPILLRPASPEEMTAYAQNEYGLPRELQPDPEVYVWAQRATDADLMQAAADLASATESVDIYRLLQIFRWRAYPSDPALLISLADCEDRKAARTARLGLQHVGRNVQVREAALRWLEETPPRHQALKLLTLNYAPGDATLILKLLRRTRDTEEFHGLAQEALNVIKNNDDDAFSGCVSLVYDRTPCSVCRGTAFDLMDKHGWLTPDILQEAAFDCNDVVRDRAGELLKTSI